MSDQTIFDKIIRKEINSEVVYETEDILAFRDIAPQAPVHILVIPKNRDGLKRIQNAEDRHEAILGKLMLAVTKIARQQKLEKGYRIVINNGQEGGQLVQHLHLHLLGGSQCTWPPGTHK